MAQRRSSIGDRLGARGMRRVFNLWPAIRGTGVRVEHVADDFSEVRVRLPLSWRTRNYVGTIFGGSLYASVDPFLMLILMRRLGDDYVVWDKAASIRFQRPATRTLRATMRVGDEELAELRAAVDAAGELDRTWTVTLADDDGVVHASVEKVLYLATRTTYDAKQAARRAARTD
jgi:acyl-coenzyme A thioesterase PaaI-like protein